MTAVEYIDTFSPWGKNDSIGKEQFFTPQGFTGFGLGLLSSHNPAPHLLASCCQGGVNHPCWGQVLYEDYRRQA
jgi:hypothetical protein